MKKLAIIGLAMLLLAGCAAGLQTVAKTVTVQGVQHPYVFAEGRGVHGATLQVMDRYSEDGKVIEARDAAGSAGILSSFLHGGLAGAEMGAGIGAGLAVQGAARVSQSANSGSPSASVANKNFNAQAQGQGQGQAQGQLQLQGQQQGQTTGALSPIIQ
jgi:hypothetical protein